MQATIQGATEVFWPFVTLSVLSLYGAVTPLLAKHPAKYASPRASRLVGAFWPGDTQIMRRMILGVFTPCDCTKCRIGTEHEKLGYYFDSHKRLEYETIKFLLENLCSRFDWEPVMENEYIIGANYDGQSVSLEPGGQLELSGAPVDTLHKTCAEVSNHLYQVGGTQYQ